MRIFVTDKKDNVLEFIIQPREIAQLIGLSPLQLVSTETNQVLYAEILWHIYWYLPAPSINKTSNMVVMCAKFRRTQQCQLWNKSNPSKKPIVQSKFNIISPRSHTTLENMWSSILFNRSNIWTIKPLVMVTAPSPNGWELSERPVHLI